MRGNPKIIEKKLKKYKYILKNSLIKDSELNIKINLKKYIEWKREN